jgi:hypothetical protein
LLTPSEISELIVDRDSDEFEHDMVMAEEEEEEG